MITEYAVPSLALNYHSKKYQIIYESVYIVIFVYMHEKQILMQEWICMKCPLKLISISILDQHAWAYWDMVARGILFLNSQTICANINGFQIPAKTSCTGHRWRKAKDFFVFCSGKICLVCFHGLFFCFICHLCLLHKINAQTPITANLSTYLIHEFLVNVKCRMDGSHRKPYICLSFDFLIQYSANGTCLTLVSMQKYVTSLWLLWKSYI